jgi:hypothetical protein
MQGTKKIAWGIAGGLVLLALLVQWKRLPEPQLPAAPPNTELTTTTEAQEIFQKAFWRRPTPADKMLHAERREWTNKTDGVRQWQWFLAVEPGPGLVDAVTKAFTLKPGQLNKQHYTSAPKWLREMLNDESTLLTDSTGSFHLIHDAKQNILLATDLGHGFAEAMLK